MECHGVGTMTPVRHNRWSPLQMIGRASSPPRRRDARFLKSVRSGSVRSLRVESQASCRRHRCVHLEELMRKKPKQHTRQEKDLDAPSAAVMWGTAAAAVRTKPR